MRIDQTGAGLYLVLVLAALAAILSFDHSGGLYRQMQFLLMEAASLEGSTDAGAIGAGTEGISVPPKHLHTILIIGWTF